MKSNYVSTIQMQIAELAKDSRTVFYSLNKYITIELLMAAFQMTRKDGATGIDEQTYAQYAENLQDNLSSLVSRIKSGTYYAPPVKRTYIPKSDGTKRPLGIPTIEDKIAQRAILILLEPIYENDFHSFSFGFRPRKSAHDALGNLRVAIERGYYHVIDADISKYFDSIDHVKLREFLANRLTDGVIRKMIDKWLKAGILEDGAIRINEFGTPQGGVISPLLANIYLHYVLDEWFIKEIRPLLKKPAGLVRYADDFVMIFSEKSECERVYRVLPKRFEKFGLKIHPDKSKMLHLDEQPKNNNDDGDDSNNDHQSKSTFNFLGFTHVLKRKNKFSKPFLLRTTMKERFSRAMSKLTQDLKKIRHKKVSEQQALLKSKLLGHYNYYGINGNSKRIAAYRYYLVIAWFKSLRRRSRKRNFAGYSSIDNLLKRYPLPYAKVIPRLCSC